MVRFPWQRLLSALLLGVVIEAVLLGFIHVWPPDPPLRVYGTLLVLSQMPGMLLGNALVPSHVPRTNTTLTVMMFLFQTPVYTALAYLALSLVRRYREQRPAATTP